MQDGIFYRVLADLVLLVHVLFVVFVVAGLVLICAGGMRGWSWVRNPWFRLAHLVAIGIVVAQAWLGVLCPLTSLEIALRTRAGSAVYSGSFIAHWLESMLYYSAPPWLFLIGYSAFGLVTLASWFMVRPQPFAGYRRR